MLFEETYLGILALVIIYCYTLVIIKIYWSQVRFLFADMAKLVDVLVLGTSGVIRVGSNPSIRISWLHSSAGQSIGLLIWWPQVQILLQLLLNVSWSNSLCQISTVEKSHFCCFLLITMLIVGNYLSLRVGKSHFWRSLPVLKRSWRTLVTKRNR